MEKITVFHEDVFYEYFRPYKHPAASSNIWGGDGLETFGKDLQLVRGHDSDHVWTVVDGGEGSDQWITPGFRHVNRICYLLTEVPHHDAPVEFRIENRTRFLTPLGLARRISTLRKIMSNYQVTNEQA